ncbi:tRNA pseudouridine(55) synthase TruB [Acanthopleuribacter pedis]|uniref:tRNA pseudouridine synthase B n=1 Tax=Acanthopleuribacter pedis TaxID=442870 RepID=A0A8J7Q9N6_9BACT|nr:tRNA pseudouridine(55) synthase TruB [Acanthopleuribacter pedis]MBO1316961.1 tRNA pseudouridine(55) synthase TruB [Acanthopleuribacter pedis]
MNQAWYPFVFLPIHKPVGPTSHDMVARVRRLLPRKTKVGHTGTLDPFASGILLMAVGKATKFADFLHELPKQYMAEIRLGVRTNTLDPTGEEDLTMPVPALTPEKLEAVRQSFLGPYDQIPPAFSAKKVQGKKSYQLARKNQAVDLPPKRVTLHELELTQNAPDRLMCRVVCSTGTYVRALARDIGEALGTCASLTTLVRDKVGDVSLDACADVDKLTFEELGRWSLPVSQVLSRFPEVALPHRAYTFFIEGRPFHTDQSLPSEFLAVFKRGEEMGAVFRCKADKGTVAPRGLCYLAPDLQ